MDNVKKLKRGEILFKEGEACTSIYMIQSGKLNLILERGGKKIEIVTLGTSQVLGEAALFNASRNAFTAEAAQECKVLEIPVDVMKAQFEKAMPGIKLMVKSMSEDVKQARTMMKNIKMEGDKSPMPQALIPRTFTMLQIVARHIGKKNDAANPNKIDLNWGIFKMYVNRFFGEAPTRFRSLMDLLQKTQMATLKIEKNEEGQEELSWVYINNIQAIEDFAEFYQYHLFKGAKAEAIFVDPLALKAAKALVEVSTGVTPDHKGASHVENNQVLAFCKEKYKFDLKNTHLDVLEKKGLFVVRKSPEGGPTTLGIDRSEFEKMATYWGIIYEIDKWNDKGFVDLNEKEEVQAATGMACSSCQQPIQEQHKFCPSCGFKVAA